MSAQKPAVVQNNQPVQSPDEIIANMTDELHRRLHVQARNLLFDYRLAPGRDRGMVPHEHVQNLMKLYGSLIAKLIITEQAEAISKTLTTQDKLIAMVEELAEHTSSCDDPDFPLAKEARALLAEIRGES
jgi:hypothetical protein